MNRRLILAVAFGVACSPSRDTQTDEAARSPMGGAAPTASQDMGDMPMGDEAIRIGSRQAALAGVRFAVVRDAAATRTVRAVATVVPNERGLGVINARVDGWIEELHVKETGRHVNAGDPLFELYAPDLVTAQQEFLLARELASTSDGGALIDAARSRLRLWDISAEQIDALEHTGEVQRTLTIRSAFSGHVMQRHAIEGQRVRTGDRLFEIADLSTVWIEPAIFEQDIRHVRIGQRATLFVDAIPGRSVDGRVTFLHPAIDAHTRTLRIRIEIPNRDFAIKPNMYATAELVGASLSGAVVPLTAILPTGDRNLAFVVRGGAVHPTQVVVAARGDSTIVVTDGLTVGDTVVASATFLFDSESSLAAAMAGIMLDMGMGLDMGGMPGMDMEMPMEGAQPDSGPGTRPDGAR